MGIKSHSPPSTPLTLPPPAPPRRQDDRYRPRCTTTPEMRLHGMARLRPRCGDQLPPRIQTASSRPATGLLGANGRLAFASCTLPSTARRPEGSASPVCPAPCSHGTACDFPRRMTTLTTVRCSRVSSPPIEASSKPQAPRTTSASRSAPFSRRWPPRRRPFSCIVRREKIVRNPPPPPAPPSSPPFVPPFLEPIGPGRDVERTSPPRPSTPLSSSTSSPNKTPHLCPLQHTTLNLAHPPNKPTR